jgi:hypothetical protein
MRQDTVGDLTVLGSKYDLRFPNADATQADEMMKFSP